MPRKKQKPFRKLPNGFGSVRKLSGNRRKPYVASAPSFKLNGVTVPGETNFGKYFIMQCRAVSESGVGRIFRLFAVLTEG